MIYTIIKNSHYSFSFDSIDVPLIKESMSFLGHSITNYSFSKKEPRNKLITNVDISSLNEMKGYPIIKLVAKRVEN
jgi:hypothetical protein